MHDLYAGLATGAAIVAAAGMFMCGIAAGDAARSLRILATPPTPTLGAVLYAPARLPSRAT